MTFEDVSEIPTINRVEWLDYFAQRATERNEIRYSTNCDNEQEIIIAVKNAGNRYSRNKKGRANRHFVGQNPHNRFIFIYL